MTSSRILKSALFFFFILSIPLTSQAAEWKGYVCKVTDFTQCEKGNKRIYPRSERYDDKETCYKEFKKIYEIDPEMNLLYPQTNNPRSSYIFGCVKD